MNRRIKSVCTATVIASFSVVSFLSCNNNPDKVETVAVKAVAEQKLEGAISCTKMGIPVADSALYMDGGGKEFVTSVVNKIESTGSAPQGMVVVPGGEFSMGGVNPVGMMDGGKENMNDARPVHRVYVDGFYMDETEVTNAQFEQFVAAIFRELGYKTHTGQVVQGFCVAHEVDLIAQKQKAIDLETLNHFKRVRTLCTSDQLAKYDTMVLQMVRKMGKPVRHGESEKTEKKK